MTTSVRFHEGAHHVVALPGSLTLRRVGDLLDKMGKQTGIALLPEQNAVRGLSVAARATRFLVVLLDRLGQGKVDHGSHGSFVDAQPKGYGPHQNAHLIGHPAFLVLSPQVGFHLPVVGNSGDSVVSQEVHRFFHAGDSRGIYDHAPDAVMAQALHE